MSLSTCGSGLTEEGVGSGKLSMSSGKLSTREAASGKFAASGKLSTDEGNRDSTAEGNGGTPRLTVVEVPKRKILQGRYQYEMGEVLGRGSYAKVRMCTAFEVDATFAVKIFKVSLLKRRRIWDNQGGQFKTAFDDVRIRDLSHGATPSRIVSSAMPHTSSLASDVRSRAVFGGFRHGRCCARLPS
jgi:hypothetical protein